ncbi:MAG: dTDP-4-amino-4,6-dideoxygalactose transaminase [Planctomycetaceae bacterium]|jgi:dTDP-4-amino-4,6-dideoxygalactose transaminase
MTFTVPMLDLKLQYESIKDEIDEAIQQVMASQHFIMGPQVAACENAIAEYSQCNFGIGVSSGTDALLVSLMAEDIGPGDEVITTAYSFFATAGCIARLGATPVFVDIDPDSFNIAPDLIAEKITPRTKAIIPVHLFGQMADMDPIMDIAKEHNLVVIEDAAQAIGAEYKGQRAGSIGHYGCFSFFPAKNLGCAGDGGMVVTNDPEGAERLRVLRVHGSKPKYFHKVIGGNFRLDTIQAAIVSVKLRHLDSWTERRQQNAARYDQFFANHNTIRRSPPAEGRHVYNQYVIRVEDRATVMSSLKKSGVPSAIYYPKPLHLQECFAVESHETPVLPLSELASEESLALPISPELTESQLTHVASSLLNSVDDISQAA